MADRRSQIAELRAQVARVDVDLLAKLEARAALSRKIHELLEGEAPVPDVSDSIWVEELVNTASGALPSESVRAIFLQIRAASRALEQPVKVAYLGTEGGFCHLAAKAHFGASVQCIELQNAAELFEEVKRERAAFAVFALESSTEGLLHLNVSALAQSSLVIVGQREVEARYDLSGLGGDVASLATVYLTPGTNGACESFLLRDLSHARTFDVRTHAMALRLAAAEPSSAAIVPEVTARGSGLNVLRSDVGDLADARVRFAVAGPRPASRSGHDLTCLLFSVNDQPGALYDVLRHFSERNINMKRMQARPVRGEVFDYLFYVELEGHVTDRALVTALESIKRATRYVKVLGSFPV